MGKSDSLEARAGGNKFFLDLKFVEEVDCLTMKIIGDGVSVGLVERMGVVAASCMCAEAVLD